MSHLMNNKRVDNISNIMSKHHGILTENFFIFFFKSREIGNVPESEFDIL